MPQETKQTHCLRDYSQRSVSVDTSFLAGCKILTGSDQDENPGLESWCGLQCLLLAVLFKFSLCDRVGCGMAGTATNMFWEKTLPKSPMPLSSLVVCIYLGLIEDYCPPHTSPSHHQPQLRRPRKFLFIGLPFLARFTPSHL